jgi:hypothetical protein
MPTQAWWKQVEITTTKEGMPYQYTGYVLTDLAGTYPHEYTNTSITWTEVTD